MTTNDPGDVFDGAKHARAAWLELLPPTVETAYLAERAAAHAMRLAPSPTQGHDGRHHRARRVRALTLCAQSDPGWLGLARRATADLEGQALRALARKLGGHLHRERALRERSAPVARLVKRGDRGGGA